MRIFVLGAGAMGGLFGAKLHLAGHNVWLYDIWQEHISRIIESGLIIEEVDGTKETVTVSGSASNVDPIEHADLVLVEVKTYDTHEALQSVKVRIPKHCNVLSLQNGIGNLEEMQRALPDHDRILLGTTAQGANVVAPGHVVRTGAGPSEIGDPRAAQDHRSLEEIAEAFSGAGIPMTVAPDVLPAVWAKLAANAAINPLTALTGLRNGDLRHDPGLKATYSAIVSELVSVMDALEIDRIKDDYIEYAEYVMKATATSYSSMLQDIRYRRRTEIDAINGAVARFGEESGVATPTNKMISSLITQRQQDYLNEGRGAFERKERPGETPGARYSGSQGRAEDHDGYCLRLSDCPSGGSCRAGYDPGR